MSDLTDIILRVIQELAGEQGFVMSQTTSGNWCLRRRDSGSFSLVGPTPPPDDGGLEWRGFISSLEDVGLDLTDLQKRIRGGRDT